jgi:uncharacterized protein YegL
MKTLSMSIVTSLIWAAVFAATLSAADQNVVVVLDDSGSMDEGMRGGQRKMDAAKDALLSVLENLPDEAHVGVLALNSRLGGSPWIAPLGPVDRASIKQKIASVRAGGATPLGAAMKEAADALLDKRQKEVYGNYRLLIVTDGEAGDQELVDQYLPAIKARGLITDVIGVSMRGDHSLATQVNTYRRADDRASLAQAIAEVFAETSDDSGDAGESDYDLLSGLPDEVAAAVLISLAETDNQPIGEASVASTSSAPAGRAPAPPRTAARPPATNSGSGGAGGACTAFFLLLVFGAFILFVRTLARGTRNR